MGGSKLLAMGLAPQGSATDAEIAPSVAPKDNECLLPFTPPNPDPSVGLPKSNADDERFEEKGLDNAGEADPQTPASGATGNGLKPARGVWTGVSWPYGK